MIYIYMIFDIYIYRLLINVILRHFFRHVHECHVSELVNDYQLGMFEMFHVHSFTQNGLQ